MRYHSSKVEFSLFVFWKKRRLEKIILTLSDLQQGKKRKMKWAYLDSQYMYLLSPTRSNLGAGGHHGLAGLPDYHISHEKKYVHRGCRIVQGWIELSVFIRKRSGSICLCPREISNLYLLRLLWRLLEAAGGCWEARRTS